MLLEGKERQRAIEMITQNHYAHSVSSAKSYYFEFEGAYVVFSIPANKNIAKYLLGFAGNVWELSRMWAPNGHRSNLLTQAISLSVKELLKLETSIDALVSYADPNVGHEGFVYRAASWIYTGQTDDGRYYTDASGQVVARRKFHSGSKILTKSEILALGYSELKRPGKHRYVRPISKRAKRHLTQRAPDLGQAVANPSNNLGVAPSG